MAENTINSHKAPIIPWFMVGFDTQSGFGLGLASSIFIYLPNVPISVSSSKEIKYNERSTPGGEAGINFGGYGFERINFTIDLIKKNNTFGCTLELAQFFSLRNAGNSSGLAGLISSAISLFSDTDSIEPKSFANPKVVFWYGTGTALPCIYFVERCDFELDLFNSLGYPQRASVQLSLIYDNNSGFNEANKVAQQTAALLGLANSTFGFGKSLAKIGAIDPSYGDKPYSGLFY